MRDPLCDPRFLGVFAADSTNAAAAVAQAALQAAQAAKAQQKQEEHVSKKILANIQQPDNMTSEEKLAHQAAQWSSQQQHHQLPSTSAATAGTFTEGAKYRKCFLTLLPRLLFGIVATLSTIYLQLFLMSPRINMMKARGIITIPQLASTTMQTRR